MGLNMDALVNLALSAFALIIVACVLFTVLKGIEGKRRAKAAQNTPCQSQPFYAAQPFCAPTAPIQKRSKTTLDVITIVTNVILTVLYVPFGLFSFFGIFMADNPPDLIFGALLLYVAVMLFLAVLICCVAGILWSVMARVKGKSKLAFTVQFLPIGVFAVGLLLLLLSGLFA